MNQTVREISAELESAIVRELRREWNTLNVSHFKSGLIAPVFALSDAESWMGRWSGGDRTIEIARRLVLGQPWGVVVEVLKHEVAHQYVHEVLCALGETAHGEAFRRTCASLGIDAAASGMPDAPVSDGGETAPLPRRIAKLLALAESPNQHEAEGAMREAQRLMLKFNIDVCSGTADGGQSAARRNYRFRHLGEPTGRLQPHQRFLASILGQFFFVESIWVTVHRPLLGQRGTVLEICGTPENLEMASYVHDFLLHSAERLWREHKYEMDIEADRDRRSYLSGVMRGFYEKCKAAERESVQEGLVWVRDPGLSGYLRQRHPYQRTVRSTARASADVFEHGQNAGRNLVLHKPVGAPQGNAQAQLPARRA